MTRCSRSFHQVSTEVSGLVTDGYATTEPLIGLRQLLVKNIYRTLQRNVDVSMEEAAKHSSRVLRDTLLARILSAQMVLSYRDTPDHKDIPCKVSWVMLNLKSICTSLAQTMPPREVPRPGESVVWQQHHLRTNTQQKCSCPFSLSSDGVSM